MTAQPPQAGDPNEELALGQIDQGTGRLVNFSDAVMAIAMTLLAVDLPVPTGNTDEELWESFLGYLDYEYFSFALSFGVIALFWVGHHRMFSWIERVGPGLIWRNFVFLFLIATMPFATRLLDDTDGSFLGTVFYAAVVTCIGLVRLEMLLHTRRHGQLRGRLRRANLAPLIVPTVAFGLSIPIAVISPAAARYSWIAVAILSIAIHPLIPRRRDSASGRH